MAKEDCYSVLCLFLISCVGCVLGVETVVQFVETGKSHPFKPVTSGTIKNIEWRWNNGKNILVEWDDPAEPVWYDKYKNQAILDINTGALTINNLKKSDSGRFDFSYHTGGPVTSFTFRLNVIDRVPKPEVDCKVIDLNTTLKCSVASMVPANFTWRGPNDLSSAGASLQVTRQENDDYSIYYCTATNEVSYETTEVTLQLCDSQETHETNVGAIVGGILALIVLGAAGVAAGVYCVKQKKGARPANHTEAPDTSVPLAKQTPEI